MLKICCLLSNARNSKTTIVGCYQTQRLFKQLPFQPQHLEIKGETKVVIVVSKVARKIGLLVTVYCFFFDSNVLLDLQQKSLVVQQQYIIIIFSITVNMDNNTFL